MDQGQTNTPHPCIQQKEKGEWILKGKETLGSTPKKRLYETIRYKAMKTPEDLPTSTQQMRDIGDCPEEGRRG
jgi:hypothetical protein